MNKEYKNLDLHFLQVKEKECILYGICLQNIQIDLKILLKENMITNFNLKINKLFQEELILNNF